MNGSMKKADSFSFSGGDLICDDCAFSKPGLILRWCETCSSAICDACILDRGHGGHRLIICYQEALSSADRKFDDVLEFASNEIGFCNANLSKTHRFQLEIVAKANDLKSQFDKRAKESIELVGLMTRQSEELAKLGEARLNANTACQRRSAMMASKSLVKLLLDRQAAIVDQMKLSNHVIAEIYEESKLFFEVDLPCLCCVQNGIEKQKQLCALISAFDLD